MERKARRNTGVKRILVTGASGFIGSNIMSYLENIGYDVYGCCRTEMKGYDGRYVACDLSKEVPELDVDAVIHTAALSPSAGAGFNDYFNNNVIATRNIMEFARKRQVQRVIYMASVSSYGKIDEILREDSPHNNADDYGLTKYVAELLVKNAETPYYSLVLPGVVGKGCRDNWLMKTARTIYHNQSFTYYNGQGLFNNVLEVTDLCRFIVALLEDGTNRSETYLLGSSEAMMVKNVVEFLKENLRSDSQLCCSTERRSSFYLDVSRALSVGFVSKPITEILDGICREVSEK